MTQPGRSSGWVIPLLFTAVAAVAGLSSTAIAAWAVTQSRVSRLEVDVGDFSKRLRKMEVIQIRIATKLDVDTTVDD